MAIARSRHPFSLSAAFAISLAGLLMSASACGPAGPPGPDPAAASGPNALVVRVIDGDTVVVAVGGREENARLLGIDTPETVHPTTPVECFGPEASARLSALLPPDTPVRLELDEESRDHFGRLLVYIHRSTDSAFINEVMVHEGLADTLAIAPNNTFRDRLAAAADAARSHRIGLWGACADADPGGG